MQSIISHTLVRNGQPFIGLVLRQVLPHINKSLITISEKSDDGTLTVLRQIEKEFPGKVEISFENVKLPSSLTVERQKQVEKTYDDWIWFLDDDDYYTDEAVQEIIKLINKEENVDGYSLTPYQLIDDSTRDGSWNNRSFTKLFKNDNINYRGGWPRDLIYKGDNILYWKKNHRVPRVDIPFFHLSYIKSGSFRSDEWAQKFAHKIGKRIPLSEDVRKRVWPIFDELNKT